MMISVSGKSFRSSLKNSMPSTSGSLISRRMMAKGRWFRISRASSALAAVATVSWRRPRTWAMPRRTASSSSTTRIWLLTSFSCIKPLLPGNYGEKNPEGGAHPHLAFHFHGAAVGLDEALDQGQPQAGADDLPGFSMFHPVEFVKYFGNLPRFDADAVVGHQDLHVVAVGQRRNPDVAAIRGVVDGVAHQVGEDLFHAAAVGPGGGQVTGGRQLQGDPLLFRLVAQELHYLYQHFSQRQGDLLQLAVPRLHLGDVQQIVDQVQQPLDLGMGPAEQFPLL